jgi:hypothetical protein
MTKLTESKAPRVGSAPESPRCVFLQPEVMAAGLSLQPVVAQHFTILGKIGFKTPGQRGRALSNEEVYEFIFLFTRPLSECCAALDKGTAFFREAALKATSYQLSPMVIHELEKAVALHVGKACGVKSNQDETR